MLTETGITTVDNSTVVGMRSRKPHGDMHPISVLGDSTTVQDTFKSILRALSSTCNAPVIVYVVHEQKHSSGDFYNLYFDKSDAVSMLTEYREENKDDIEDEGETYVCGSGGDNFMYIYELPIR